MPESCQARCPSAPVAAICGKPPIRASDACCARPERPSDVAPTIAVMKSRRRIPPRQCSGRHLHFDHRSKAGIPDRRNGAQRSFSRHGIVARPMSLLGQTLRSQTAFAPIFVRYASRSDQTIAAQRNDATCQEPTSPPFQAPTGSRHSALGRSFTLANSRTLAPGIST